MWQGAVVAFEVSASRRHTSAAVTDRLISAVTDTAVSQVLGTSVRKAQGTGSVQSAPDCLPAAHSCSRMEEGSFRGGRCIFWMQIGFMREQAVADSDMTLQALKEMACQFVDRKVSESCVFLSAYSVGLQMYFSVFCHPCVVCLVPVSLATPIERKSILLSVSSDCGMTA